METTARDFHSEEYKQIRAEVVGVLGKIDQYFRYAVVVPTGVYSWLLSSAIGVHTIAGSSAILTSPCLRLPLILVWIGWLIPPVFVFFCGLMTLAFSLRVIQMGNYLLQLENALGRPDLGWEKFNAPLMPRLTWVHKGAWLALFILCTAVSTIGIHEANNHADYCVITK
jgi:hypothetical protein